MLRDILMTLAFLFLSLFALILHRTTQQRAEGLSSGHDTTKGGQK
jgi:hypothetical protein